jgi:hypothetical protein
MAAGFTGLYDKLATTRSEIRKLIGFIKCRGLLQTFHHRFRALPYFSGNTLCLEPNLSLYPSTHTVIYSVCLFEDLERRFYDYLFMVLYFSPRRYTFRR